jgi:hypothetical protein
MTPSRNVFDFIQATLMLLGVKKGELKLKLPHLKKTMALKHPDINARDLELWFDGLMDGVEISFEYLETFYLKIRETAAADMLLEENETEDEDEPRERPKPN